MGIFTNRDHTYSKVPLSVGDNRDEHFLIDVLGTWIPECDLIYYGLLNSKYSNELYKLKNAKIIKPHDIYLDTFYFSGDDLIRYLASPDDSLVDLSEEYLNEVTNAALDNYLYVPCNETMIRHSIIELAYFDFAKSITLLYPWDIREIDYQYLKSILPEAILRKINLASGDICSYLKNNSNSSTKYTTIILNSIDALNELIDNCDEYNTSSSFFLLRNHSENVSSKIVEIDGEKQIEFTEEGNDEILLKLIDIERMIPKTQMRFARFEPHLFVDANPVQEGFISGQ